MGPKKNTRAIKFKSETADNTDRPKPKPRVLKKPVQPQKVLPNIHIYPSSDYDSETDIMHPRVDHVPVLPPLADSPKKKPEIFVYNNCIGHLNNSLALKYREKITDRIQINVARIGVYYRRMYRFMIQVLSERLPGGMKVDTLSPQNFESVCCTLTRVRILYVQATLKNLSIPEKHEILMNTVVPNCIGNPINGIGVVTTGSNYTLVIPDDTLSLDMLNQNVDTLVGSEQMEIFADFVKLLQKYGAMGTCNLSKTIGGNLWWTLMNKGDPVEEPNVSVCSWFSNVTKDEVEIARLVHPHWAALYSKETNQRVYILKSSHYANTSEAGLLPFNIA